jgi:hypothetical protein
MRFEDPKPLTNQEKIRANELGILECKLRDEHWSDIRQARCFPHSYDSPGWDWRISPGKEHLMIVKPSFSLSPERAELIDAIRATARAMREGAFLMRLYATRHGQDQEIEKHSLELDGAAATAETWANGLEE